MNPILLTLCLAATASAQLPTPVPKKDPFAGFGGTSLDRKKPGPTAPSPAPAATAPLAAPAAVPGTQPSPEKPLANAAVVARFNTDPSKGIVLFSGWDKRVTGPARKQNLDMADLRAILQDYGEPKDDLDLHPDVEVFPGIRYLSPLNEAVEKLSRQFGSLGIGLDVPIATEGFPLGLGFKKYDKSGASKADFKHVYLLLDNKAQVVSIAFMKVHGPFVDVPEPPFVLIPGRRFRENLIDKKDGASGVWVWDARSRGKYVVVHSIPGLNFPAGDSKDLSPAASLRDTSGKSYTWYVPQPMINLILYCSQLSPDPSPGR